MASATNVPESPDSSNSSEIPNSCPSDAGLREALVQIDALGLPCGCLEDEECVACCARRALAATQPLSEDVPPYYEEWCEAVGQEATRHGKLAFRSGWARGVMVGREGAERRAATQPEAPGAPDGDAIKCGTFADPASIPPDVRARMDLDRAEAEAANVADTIRDWATRIVGIPYWRELSAEMIRTADALDPAATQPEEHARGSLALYSTETDFDEPEAPAAPEVKL